jgi:DnaJ-class molecular chaperone
MRRKKEKPESPTRPHPAKSGQCDNCSGTGLVSYKKLNQVTKKHEQVKETCIMCSGSGKG